MTVPTALRSRGHSEHPDRVDFLVDTFQRLSLPSGGSSPSIPSNVRGSLPHWAQLDRTDLSLRSSSSSSSAIQNSGRPPVMATQDPFTMTQSRVLRLSVRTPFSEYTLPDCVDRIKALRPTLWKSSQSTSPTPDVFFVFKTHEEACTALSHSTPSFPLFPALESELEHIQNLHQVLWSQIVDDMSTSMARPQMHPYNTRPTNTASPLGRLPNGLTPLRTEAYNISTNPPNPKLSFRAGDWMCSVRHCAAHNFGRNVACIRCGAPRAISNVTETNMNHSPVSPTHNISPRFLMANNGSSTTPTSLATNLAQMTLSQHSHHSSLSLSQPQSPITPLTAQMPLSAPPAPPKSYPPIPSISPASKPPSPSYPLLTPSGHTLSAGGRVRNISRDPLSPCIMYWPDNEPLPERGQIRPNGSTVMQYPPIINTGNKGAAEKQPGDWHCSKCNYLNWRRRKVCQTCFPYAEGNGDSISATVQAERITLLANVLSRTSSAVNSTPPPNQLSSTLSSPLSTPSPHPILPPVGGIERQLRSYASQDQLGQEKAQYDFEALMDPIYQTSGKLPSANGPRSSHHAMQPLRLEQSRSPAAATFGQPAPPFQIQNESKLLPSFLQEIIHSPSLSPTTSSASCSSVFDGPHYTYSSNTSLNASPDSSVGRVPGNVEDRRRRVYAGSNGSDLSIWRLDGEETRSIRKGFNPTIGSSSNVGTIGSGMSGSGSDRSSDLGDFDIAGKTPTNHPVFA